VTAWLRKQAATRLPSSPKGIQVSHEGVLGVGAESESREFDDVITGVKACGITIPSLGFAC